MEDLYSTLGVTKSATADEIKKAYRNLAFKYHPDRNQGDKSAEEKFKKINAAYSVLGDETKRRQYDLYGAGDASAAGGGSGYSNPRGQEGYRTGSYGYSGDPFSDFFGGYGFGRGADGGSWRNGPSHSGSDGRSWQESYTWTSRTTDGSVSRAEGFRRFCNGVLKAFIGFGMLSILRYFFPINILCLIAGINGASNAFHSLKYIFAGKEGS